MPSQSHLYRRQSEEYMHLLSGPRLETMVCSSRSVPSESQLSSVFNNSPFIQNLGLEVTGWAPQYYWNKTICQLHRLQSFRIRGVAIPSKRILYLATLATLKELALRVTSRSSVGVSDFRLRQPGIPLFPQLRRIQWNAPSISELHDLLHSTTPPVVEHVELTFGIIDEKSMSALNCLLSDIASPTASHTLTMLYLSSEDSSYVALDPQEFVQKRNWLSRETLAPVMNCVALQCLHIGLLLPFNFNDDDLLDFMGSFPELRYLNLGGKHSQPVKTSKHITLDSLAAASKRCPHLLAMAIIVGQGSDDDELQLYGFEGHSPFIYYDDNGIVTLSKQARAEGWSPSKSKFYVVFVPNVQNGLEDGFSTEHDVLLDKFIYKMRSRRKAVLRADGEYLPGKVDASNNDSKVESSSSSSVETEGS